MADSSLESPAPHEDAAPLTPHGALPEGGTVRPMTRWGTPVMHRAKKLVEVFDSKLATLAADMVATMYAAEGVGLAADQIGEDVAIYVFDCPDASGQRTVGIVCNPVLTLPEGDDRRLDVDLEGCLSFPGAFVECGRPDWAAVDGVGLTGEPVHFEGDGLLARCLQHETDHTNGTVFGDRISAKARKKLTKEHDRLAKEFPAEWPVGAASTD